MLKEVQDILNLIRKKEKELYISANKDLLFNIGKKEKMIVKYTKTKELIGLERVHVEKSWGAELINQIIKEEHIRTELKESLTRNIGKRKIVVYTDRLLQKKDTQQLIGYSIVQIDEQNKIVCSHKGKIEK